MDFGDRWGAALTLLNVGLAEVHLDRLDEAERDVRQALRESADIGSVVVVQACFEGMAIVAAQRGRAGTAASLLGAAAAVREDHDIGDLAGEDLVFHEQVVASLSSTLGQEALERELDLGRKLPLDETVKLALDDDA